MGRVCKLDLILRHTKQASMPNFKSFWLYLMRLFFSLFGLIPLGPLNICVQPLFPVCPLAIVRLQVQPGNEKLGNEEVGEKLVHFALGGYCPLFV